MMFRAEPLTATRLMQSQKLRFRAPLLLVALLALGGCELLSEEVPEEDLDLEAFLDEQQGPVGPETLELAKQALADHRFEDADRLLERVLYRDPENARARLYRAEVQLGQGDSAGAMPLFTALLQQEEVAARAAQGQGISLLLIGDQVGAAKALNRAVTLNPQLWRAWNALGAYHDGQEQWSQAEDSYRKALQLTPQNAMVLNNLGFSLFMQGRADEAINVLSQALQYDPDLHLARTNLRLAFARRGQYLQAISGSKDEEMGQILNDVGYIAILRGDYKNAEAYLLRAMEAAPAFNETAWRNLKYLKTLKELQAERAKQQN